MAEKKELSAETIRSSQQPDLSRRNFIKVIGVFTLTAGGAPLISCDQPPENDSEYQPSMGYILVDSKKCQGCLTCMIACSLVHEGGVNLSLARLQVVQNPFSGWPDDIEVNQCHQCLDAPCVKACPTGALFVDQENGNVRLVDKDTCVGCGFCLTACPFEIERPIVAPDAASGTLTSRKCDLCQNAPYHFHADGGGVNGHQACVAVCPVDAIRFTIEMPNQNGSQGYDINMRDASWGRMGFATS